MNAVTIKVGSHIVAHIGNERVEGTVENIEIVENGSKYGTPTDSATVGTDEFVLDIPGRFIYSYQLQYVDNTWVG